MYRIGFGQSTSARTSIDGSTRAAVVLHIGIYLATEVES